MSWRRGIPASADSLSEGCIWNLFELLFAHAEQTTMDAKWYVVFRRFDTILNLHVRNRAALLSDQVNLAGWTGAWNPSWWSNSPLHPEVRLMWTPINSALPHIPSGAQQKTDEPHRKLKQGQRSFKSSNVKKILLWTKLDYRKTTTKKTNNLYLI